MGRGLLVKIVGLSSMFVLLVILVLSILSILNMQTLGSEIILLMGKNKLKGDIASFEQMLRNEYGQLRLENSQLLSENGTALNEQYEVVDQASKMLDIVATVFIRENNDYRRISTNIFDSNGKRAVNTFLGSGSAAYAPINAGQSYVGNAVILGKDYLTVYNPIFAENKQDVIGILFIGIEMSSIQAVTVQSSGRHITSTIIIAIVILLFSIGLNILFCGHIVVKPIHVAVEMLKDISEGEGDLTKQLVVMSQDEIGAMAYYFNMTLEKIKNLILLIKKQSIVLTDTGTELASNMNETTKAIHQIIRSIQDIKNQVISQSASVTQTNVTMENIIVNINKLNDFIEQQSRSVSKSSAGIEEMVANIQSVTKTLINNTGNVHDLAEASEIGRSGLQEVAQDIQEIARESAGLLEINEVMENIASQTNLLSMNAAIEAAHAGEAGKGFAVVADEIRKLAESSSEQSKTISIVLNKIKSSIDKITLSTDTVLKKFEAIDVEIKTVSDQEGNIRTAMEEQELGSRQILEAIAQLNSITAMVKNSSNDMHDHSKDVIQESNTLGKVTQELNKGVQDITSQVDYINYAITRVNTITDENKTNIDALVSEVLRFKIE
jgi:methyl-accepting chemotaxis protein